MLGQPGFGCPSRSCAGGTSPRPRRTPPENGSRVQPANMVVDRDDRLHQLPEPGEVELLLGVGQRVVGMRVDLDHDPVGTDRDAADRQRLDEPALAGGVARIDDDGRWVSRLRRGTAARSIVLRVYVSNVRMPRSHRITFGFPELTMYSAAISHSSTVAP